MKPVASSWLWSRTGGVGPVSIVAINKLLFTLSGKANREAICPHLVKMAPTGERTED
jgi:hypothetical protein